MKKLYILIIVLFLVFVEFHCQKNKNEREQAAAIYKTNAEATKRCLHELRGMKNIPIVGTNRKLFVDSNRLPWRIARGFEASYECGASEAVDNIFYWTGKEIIPQSVWLNSGHTLIDRPGPEDWLIVSADVYLGLPKRCKGTREGCEPLPRRDPEWHKHFKIIKLKNYPIDVLVPLHPDAKAPYSANLNLRDWPLPDSKPSVESLLMCSVDIKDKTDKEIEELNVKTAGYCPLDFGSFLFRAGSARINLSSSQFKTITPAVRALHQYLNESILPKE